MRSQVLQVHRPHLPLDFEPATTSIHDLILDYLSAEGAVTFVDLEDDVPGFAGELSLRATSDKNTILWRGVSAAALHALCELQRSGTISFKEVVKQTYQAKGKTLQLPTAKRKGFPRRWKPVLVQLAESVQIDALND